MSFYGSLVNENTSLENIFENFIIEDFQFSELINIDETININLLTEALDAKAIKEKFIKVFDQIKEALGKLIERIKEALGNFVQFIKTKILHKIFEKAEKIKEKIKNDNKVNKVKTEAASNTVLKVLNLANFCKSYESAITRIDQGLKNIFVFRLNADNFEDLDTDKLNSFEYDDRCLFGIHDKGDFFSKKKIEEIRELYDNNIIFDINDIKEISNINDILPFIDSSYSSVIENELAKQYNDAIDSTKKRINMIEKYKNEIEKDSKSIIIQLQNTEMNRDNASTLARNQRLLNAYRTNLTAASGCVRSLTEFLKYSQSISSAVSANLDQIIHYYNANRQNIDI